MLDSLGTESVLRVDKENLTLAAALRAWQLCCDTKSVTQLGLAGPELSKRLSDRHTFDSALKKCIKLGRPRGDPLDVLAFLKNLHSRLEPLTLDLLCYLIALVSFSFRDAFDVQHLLLGTRKSKTRLVKV